MATPRKQDKPLSVWQKVRCPYCLAPAGKRCKSKNGLTTATPHTDRYKEQRRVTLGLRR